MSTVAQHLLLDDIYFAAACKVLIILSNMFVGNLLIPQLFRYSKNTRALHGCIHAYTHTSMQKGINCHIPEMTMKKRKINKNYKLSCLQSHSQKGNAGRLGC